MMFSTFRIYFPVIFASCSSSNGSHPNSLMLFTVHIRATALSKTIAARIISVAYVIGIVGVIRATRAIVLDIVSITTLTIYTSEVGSIYGTRVVVGAAGRCAAPCPCSPDFSNSNVPLWLEPTLAWSLNGSQYFTEEILVVYVKRYPLKDPLIACQEILYPGLFPSLKRGYTLS